MFVYAASICKIVLHQNTVIMVTYHDGDDYDDYQHHSRIQPVLG